MENIQDAVEAHEQYVVGGDVLHILKPGDHAQLRQYGQCLQPDGEGPGEIYGVERFVDEDGHHQRSEIQEVVRELVLSGGVGLHGNVPLRVGGGT